MTEYLRFRARTACALLVPRCGHVKTPQSTTTIIYTKVTAASQVRYASCYAGQQQALAPELRPECPCCLPRSLMSAMEVASKRPAPPKPSVTKAYTNSPAKAFLAFCSEQRPQLPKGLSPGERETLLGRMPHQYRTPDAVSGPLQVCYAHTVSPCLGQSCGRRSLTLIEPGSKELGRR